MLLAEMAKVSDTTLHLKFVLEDHEIIDLSGFSGMNRWNYGAVSAEVQAQLNAMETHFVKRGMHVVS